MGTGYEKVICCVEGSDASDAVIDAGARLTGREGTLVLAHVVPPPMAVLALPAPDMTAVYAEAEAWLAARAAALRGRLGDDGPTVETVLLEGHPGIAVCEWAGHHHADLIVAASHRGLFDRALLGSFAGYVAYHAPCAVHLVRPAAAAG